MRQNKGFTLIELLIVISIIGILAGIIMTPAPQILNKSKDARTKQALSSIRTAISSYWMVNNGVYPKTLEELSPGFIDFVPSNWSGSSFSGVFIYQKETGTVTLADRNGRTDTLPSDARGINYKDY